MLELDRNPHIVRAAPYKEKSLGTLVREARRRILRNELFAQGSHASSAALAAFILLVLFGTDILSWPLMLALPLVAIGIGWYRTRKRLPGPYSVAQIVDRRMGFSDALSTATFFSGTADPDPVAEGVREAQRVQAGRLAATISARQAIPYKVPRGLYLAAVLAVVAASLFALRFGLSRRLDLRQPLANFLPESLRPGKRVEQASNRKKNPKSAPQVPDENGQPTDQNENSQADQDQKPETQTAGESDPQSPGDNAKSPGKKQGDPPDSEMATDDSQAGNEGNSGKNGDEGQEGQQGDSKNAKSPSDQQAKQDAANQGESSSLMDKMKDAVQNLMSKMKSQPQQNGQQKQDQKGQQGKSPQGAKQQNGKEGQQNSGQQGDAQDGESGEDAKNNENAQQQKGQGKSDSQQTTKQPGSGVGSQDGEKAIKNAEQLAAMGKITEILGKRSQNITGEATVEVQSTSQQLRTPYANKGAQHTQGGAEISRDEVPVALQPYVQQYFEQIRKQAPATPASPSKK